MSKYTIGVDVGGRSMKFGLFDDKGKLLDKSNIPTRTQNQGENILPDLTEHLKKIIEKHELTKENLTGIGLGMPGPILNEKIIKTAVNLGFKDNVNVADYISARLDFPVKVANDANVAALGEVWKGAAEVYNNVVMVTLGTGVGGGVILDGKILAGVTGSGGEIGHMPILEKPLEWTCGCGGNRCLEQVASATGVERLAQDYLFENEEESSLRDLNYIDAREIFQAAQDGDDIAVKVVEEYFETLARGLAIISAVVDPEAFVLGGGVSNAGEFLLDGVRKAYRKFAFPVTKDAKFFLAQLGNDAGMYGAAKMML